MRPLVFDRLVLPAAMAALLVLSLAYWWLENVPHELFGTAMFALLGWHFAVNWSWFKNLARGRYDARRVMIVGLHLFLAVNMIVLLGTSIAISKSIFAWLPMPDSIYLREIHWFSAYWVMMIVGIHLGLHWSRVMAFSRSALGLVAANRPRTMVLRIATAALAAFGAWSFAVLDVFSKLTFTYSIEVWNFKTSVAPFFGHWLGVTALPAILTHYVMTFWRNSSRQHRTTLDPRQAETSPSAVKPSSSKRKK